MNYLAWCIGFTVVAFGNFVLALRGDLWWVHALLAIALHRCRDPCRPLGAQNTPHAIEEAVNGPNPI